MVLRRARGYERLDRAGQIGDDFTDGNQLAALTLHALFSHVPQTRPKKPSGPALQELRKGSSQFKYRRNQGLFSTGSTLNPATASLGNRIV